MEWVEFTARTVDEAKEMALDRLGVAADDAEFEVVTEPKPGLFGRMRGEARVRARVRPAQARQKMDRRDRKRKQDDTEGAAPKAPKTKPAASSPAKPRAAKPPAGRAAEPEPEPISTANTATPITREQQDVNARQVGEEALKFMDELVAAFGLTATSELVEDGDDLEVRLHGDNLGLLVGPKGTTLQAVQDLARVASQRRLGDHDTRLRIDVGGYRERRKEALGRFAIQMADEVKQSGVARVLEPMSSADRKIVHDALSVIDGIGTRSEGDDPYRRVVITPAND